MAVPGLSNEMRIVYCLFRRPAKHYVKPITSTVSNYSNGENLLFFFKCLFASRDDQYMAAIYSNEGNRRKILGFNFTTIY